MKYGDKIIYMEGVIVEIHDGCVGIDLKGRLGYLKIPMRMLITDYPLVVGQEVGWNMSSLRWFSTPLMPSFAMSEGLVVTPSSTPIS